MESLIYFKLRLLSILDFSLLQNKQTRRVASWTINWSFRIEL